MYTHKKNIKRLISIVFYYPKTNAQTFIRQMLPNKHGLQDLHSRIL